MAPTPAPNAERASPPSAAKTPAGPQGLAADDPAILIGKVIAERYRVEAVLGRGGMGAVLRCHHLGLQRDVAVKLLHPGIAADPEIAARFEREASSASRLDHPNCVRVLDFGAWQPVPGGPVAKYLAMQLLEGCELAELLGRPLPPSRAIALVHQILAALEHAHAQGIVHRDLKPENVFVTRDHAGVETLKLVDFGIAKITEGDGANAKLTRMGLVFGTPRYMSPEQAAGGIVDHRSDLYTTGVMLYEMLGGLPPFLGDDAMQLLRAHLFEPPPPLPDSVPHSLRAIVLRLLDKDRAARFASATEVRDALVKASAELTTPPPATDTMASMHTMSMPAPSVSMPAPNLTMPSMAFGLIAPPPARATDWRRFAPHIGIGAALVLAILIGRSLGDDEPAPPVAASAPAWVGGLPAAAPSAGPKAPAANPVPVAAPIFPLFSRTTDPKTLAELDAMLARSEHREALARIDALLITLPEDAQLHLRRARALPARHADALAAYGRAIEADKLVLDDRDVVARLFVLMRLPAVRIPAAELALKSLGAVGLPLLVEFVQAPTPLLAYDLRHRALEAIAADPTTFAMVDVSLQRSLDLWQAAKTDAPCDRFSEGLDVIEKDPTPGVLGTLHRVPPPVAPEGATEDVKTRCLLLPTRLVAVRATVLAAHPVPAKDWTVPPAYANVGKKKKKRGLFGRMFGG